MSNTISVSAYTRRKAEKKPDPLQSDIEALRIARQQAQVDATVNAYRDKIDYVNLVRWIRHIWRRA